MKENTEFIYVYDALCGWCYGFSPVLNRIYEERKDEMKFSVVSGGLRVGDQVSPIGSMGAYIKNALPRLQEMTGANFGQPFIDLLDEGTQLMDSTPPATALAIFRSKHPEQVVPFASALQKAHFIEGADFNNPEFYKEFAQQFGENGDAFVEEMQTDEARQLAMEDFQMAQAMGITGFPAVVLRVDDKYYLLSRGYTDYTTLNERINSAISKKPGQ